jgi:hypothetical protein
MRAVWLADILTDAGLTVRPYPGWETRGKNDLDPMGVMLHHTVTKPTTADVTVDKMLAVTGSSTTPAPLANYSTNRDGTISIIAAGTANHGGSGRWDGVSGNRYFFGDEMKNLGTSSEPWPAVQLESARRAAAAILNHIGAPAQMLCGHKEYATPAGRKVDPHSLNMNMERDRVAALMRPPEENLMLPIGPSSPAEDIRSVQGLLNTAFNAGLTENGTWDAATKNAAALHLGSATGDAAAKAGNYVNARMYRALLIGLVRAVGGGVVDQVARDAAALANSRLSKVKSVL